MPQYRIYQLTEPYLDKFREGPPKDGRLALRTTHYEEVGAIEADGPYDCWKRMQGGESEAPGGRALGVGDVLVEDGSDPLVCQYWGFDPAAWADREQDPETPEAVS